MGATRIAVVAAVVAAVSGFGTPATAQETPTCFGEPATIEAEAGVTTLGTDGDDVIVGTSGPDLIRAFAGNDLICGLGGADLIYGNGGNDSINGGPGADVIYGGRKGDHLIGGIGNDEIYGQRGHDKMFGRAGRDVLGGSTGNDELLGGNGDDTLFGRSGNDLLGGGKGRDSCRGGLGEDVLSSCNEAPAHPSRIYAIGDSITVAAGSQFCDELQRAIPGAIEEAAVSRQFSAAQALVSSAVAGGVPDDTVFIIALGTNGPFSASAFDALFAVDSTSRFLFVNVKVPRSWEASVNETLSSGVNRHSNRAALVDWHSIASANPGYLAADGIHITCTGAAVYTNAMAAGLEKLPPL
ncbi:MAG: hypothetical protein ACR2PK_20070 [Acidimicrobiales bacterium]